jgi:thymidylate synthase
MIIVNRKTISESIGTATTLLQDEYVVKNSTKHAFDTNALITITKPDVERIFHFTDIGFNLVGSTEYKISEHILQDELLHYNKFIKWDTFINALDKLKDDRDSKKAYVALWDSNMCDGSTGEIPCLLTFGFRIRDNNIHIYSHMRSNNAVNLLYVDLNIISALLVAASEFLSIPVGTITHTIDSLIIYKDDYRS